MVLRGDGCYVLVFMVFLLWRCGVVVGWWGGGVVGWDQGTLSESQ